ncbi:MULTISPECIES: staygreen family protein [unclassified Sedimentibacter]|uniref:staygreen family protein n=1 Tax=unclassified Sedimentibacter TaxID=2649220 RepID=UPI0027DF14D6|nr:staygreen family protein [Sedimentibacter sp. MB35-C1]WMJ77090.1 staygreen family protein [Sedimentibacter sp. MB35-C1]
MLTKLTVDYQLNAEYENMADRVYTLTHSDYTGQRILFIGNQIDKDRLSKCRDEVEGRWIKENCKFELQITCNLYSEHSLLTLQERYEKFKSHIVRAITAIVNGDKDYILKNNCAESNVNVRYISDSKKFVEYRGNVSDYLK